MKLNSREREAVHIMISFFMKGGPEMRIAEYLFDRGFTKKQVYHFLNDDDKLGPLMNTLDNTAKNIYGYFCRLNGDYDDWSRVCGTKLQNFIEKHSKNERVNQSIGECPDY